jgi:uncharacterized OB-fold protein
MGPTPKHPSLYRLAGDNLVLLFGQCRACQALTFPANAYGCSACGADALSTIERPAEGTLKAVVTLKAQVLPGLDVPQVIGDVEIAPGIVEEVLIEGTEDGLAPGMKLAGVAHPLEGDLFDCRFRA